MKKQREKKLYRKKNTTARGVKHNCGGDYKSKRNSKNSSLVKMKKGFNRGLDYTPLYKFLLKRVGFSWDETFSLASNRLDQDQPIYHIVSVTLNEADEYVRIGESSYYSGLYVDDEGVLRVVNPELNETSFSPICPCCTHTFNGIQFTKKHK